jgi:hypothetical protein
MGGGVESFAGLCANAYAQDALAIPATRILQTDRKQNSVIATKSPIMPTLPSVRSTWRAGLEGMKPACFGGNLFSHAFEVAGCGSTTSHLGTQGADACGRSPSGINSPQGIVEASPADLPLLKISISNLMRSVNAPEANTH